MLRRCLPLLTALAFAVGAANAHRLPPLTAWGDVYSHVPNHLVTAGMALLVGASLLGLVRSATTAPARRAVRLTGGAWGLVTAVFVVDAVGGGIGDRSGDYAIHDVAMVLLPAVGLLLLAATVVLLVTRGARPAWPVRLAAVASAPGTLALNVASSTLWLLLGLTAATAWLVVAVAPSRPADAVRPPREPAAVQA